MASTNIPSFIPTNSTPTKFNTKNINYDLIFNKLNAAMQKIIERNYKLDDLNTKSSSTKPTLFKRFSDINKNGNITVPNKDESVKFNSDLLRINNNLLFNNQPISDNQPVQPTSNSNIISNPLGTRNTTAEYDNSVNDKFVAPNLVNSDFQNDRHRSSSQRNLKRLAKDDIKYRLNPEDDPLDVNYTVSPEEEALLKEWETDSNDNTTAKAIGNSLKTFAANNKDNLIDTAIVGGNLLSNVITNNRLKNKELPKPILNDNISLNKNLDINAALQNTTNQYGAVKDFITANTNDSNVAGAKLSNIESKSINDRNKLFMQKANTDLQLDNKERIANNTIDSANNTLENNYNENVYNKDVQTDVTNASQINADLYNKLNNLRTNSKMQDYQDKQLDLQQQLYGNIAIGDNLAMGSFNGVTDDNFSQLWITEQQNQNPQTLLTLRNYAKSKGYKIDEATGKLIK